jgi:hypothetical protein
MAHDAQHVEDYMTMWVKKLKRTRSAMLTTLLESVSTWGIVGQWRFAR